jgi:hypothetical protein
LVQDWFKTWTDTRLNKVGSAIDATVQPSAA